MRGGTSCWRGNSYPSDINNLNNKNKCLFSALGNHVFDNCQKGAAYQMMMTWNNIVNHYRTIYGNNISNELQNKKRINIPQREHTQQVKDKQLKRVERLSDQHSRIMQAKEFKIAVAGGSSTNTRRPRSAREYGNADQ